MSELEDVWEIIDGACFRAGTERVPVREASGRVLAEPAIACVDSPPFDQSAVDGYAFRSASAGVEEISGTIAAGDDPVVSMGCVRILTGGRVPAGTFAIAKQEDCELTGNQVQCRTILKPEENIRRRGGVFASGSPIAASGTRVTPGLAGLLVAAGLRYVEARRLPRVLHVVCGNELVEAGATLSGSRIHDANGPMISALLDEYGVSCRTDRIGDDLALLEKRLARADEDLILISGGSGASERDHATRALAASGFAMRIQGVRSRPGKPLLFATRGAQAAFGLPGNPLSHWVCFHAFVMRWLDGSAVEARASLRGELRAGFWTPGRLSISEDGLDFLPTAFQHSGDLTGLIGVNAMAFPDFAGEPNVRVLVCDPALRRFFNRV